MTDTDRQFEALPDEPATESSFPWPPAPGVSVFDAFIETWKQVCFKPAEFFRRMPREGHYGAVIVYYLVIGITVAGIELFWKSLLNRSMISTFFPGTESRFGGVIEFLLSPVILLITLYFVAGACHLMLLLMRDGRHGYETSTRTFAFSYSPAICAAIPFIGNLIAFIWMIVLAIPGLREAHDTDGTKAAVAVLIPVFLLSGGMVLFVFAAMLMGILNTPL